MGPRQNPSNIAEVAAAKADAKAGWAEVDKKNGLLDAAKAEIERLRALCAARPKPRLIGIPEWEVAEWCRKIDAAGQGEGGI